MGLDPDQATRVRQSLRNSQRSLNRNSPKAILLSIMLFRTAIERFTRSPQPKKVAKRYWEEKIPNADGTKQFLFRESRENDLVTMIIALEALNQSQGWGMVFETSQTERRASPSPSNTMIRLNAVLAEGFFDTEMMVYVSGLLESGQVWGADMRGDHDASRTKLLASGHMPKQELPSEIDQGATIAAFLEQVRALDFSTPELVTDTSLLPPTEATALFFPVQEDQH